jgi:predicted acylesterase/phospholipase RssA/CRP-like cAMP-binding protein
VSAMNEWLEQRPYSETVLHEVLPALPRESRRKLNLDSAGEEINAAGFAGARSDTSVPGIAAVLAGSDLFASIPAEVLTRMAQAMQVSTLSPGHVLMSQGEECDSLYLLLQGTLLLLSTSGGPESSSLSGFHKRLRPGAVVGEPGLLTGHPRSTTVVADEEAMVAGLGREQFLWLSRDFPECMARVTEALERRQESYQLEGAASGSPLLRSMSAPLREALLARLTIERVESGATLLREGQTANKLYLVISGRLGVLKANDQRETSDSEAAAGGATLAELGRGDTVGEAALMTCEPCAQTVVALRDSLVAGLDEIAFREMIQAFPLEMMSALSRQLTQRARRTAAHRNHDRPAVSIAILPVTGGVDAATFTARLHRSLVTFGEVLAVSQQTPVVRNSTAASENRLVEWLNDQENSFRHVLYQTGGEPSRWMRRSIRQADRIFLLANAAEPPADAAIRFRELMAADLPAEGTLQATRQFHLVLLHASGASAPTGTDAWLAAFPMAVEHHHVRLDRDGDFERLARSMNHRLVGLALGGGFALGIAHIGVIRALRELNIPIDSVGGTSMGAIIGSSCALEMDWQRMLDVVIGGSVSSLKGDYTLPVLSLLTGAKMATVIGQYLERYKIEDFWLPFFSVTASLRHARMLVLRRGDALRSVLASCRAPVIFPPLPWNDDLLVDGGLVNNIPADVMRSLTPGGTVFAVDVAPSEDIHRPTEENLSISGWKQARKRWGSRFSLRPELTLMEVLGRAIRLGGVSRAQVIQADADCYLAPPLAEFKAWDFDQGRAIAEASYVYALETLGRWLEERGRPWETPPAVDTAECSNCMM